ncbi:helix-turn-helix domain-containing protein [Variovorax sp. DXTD-1]|uniref:helix-turn-helix domain-containing protein n=1 Tax=Variovorax sp. DXTD-1 TaxID=2495592 RepID=UPI000F862CFA|nr:helix-turn-helix domain-containing protein [Variovorax sp. DXTD-1]RST51582.1 helix-turn-helix domain-containing protein [Variovorax sp. DXTD-1]
MSNAVTTLCTPMRLTPAQKAVLMCLADYADDAGLAWPSVPKIGAWTCLQRTAVIEALKALEGTGLVTVDRRSGVNNRCRINVDKVVEKVEAYPQKQANHSARRTRPGNGPVRETDAHPSGRRTTPVRETDQTRPGNGPKPSIPNIEPSVTHQRSRKRAAAPCPADVPQSLMDEWLAVRKAKRAGPVTDTVLNAIRREAAKAGLGIADAITACVEFSWQGFEAEWYAQRRPQAAATSVAAGDPDSRASIEAEGLRLGLGAWTQTEQWAAYRARVRAAQSTALRS